jgi:hypothetical protein
MMANDKQNVPYASAVRSLMYAMVYTRPDIAQAVSTMSIFMSNTGRSHWKVVKWILRYLRGNTNMKLCFGGSEAKLIAYSDSDLAGDIDGRKSTLVFGYSFRRNSGMAKQVAKLCCLEHN